MYSENFYYSNERIRLDKDLNKFKRKYDSINALVSFLYFILPVILLCIGSLLFTIHYVPESLQNRSPGTSDYILCFVFSVFIMSLFCSLFIGCIYELDINTKSLYRKTRKLLNQKNKLLYEYKNLIESADIPLEDFATYTANFISIFQKAYPLPKYEEDIWFITFNIAREKYKEFESYALIRCAILKLLSKSNLDLKGNSYDYEDFGDLCPKCCNAFKISTYPFLYKVNLQIQAWKDKKGSKDEKGDWNSIDHCFSDYKVINNKEIDQLAYNLEQSYIIFNKRREDDLRINYEKFVAEFRLPDINYESTVYTGE